MPQDVWPPLTVYNNNGTHIDRAIERRKNPLTSEYDGVAGGVSGPGAGAGGGRTARGGGKILLRCHGAGAVRARNPVLSWSFVPE